MSKKIKKIDIFLIYVDSINIIKTEPIFFSKNLLKIIMMGTVLKMIGTNIILINKKPAKVALQ